MLIKESTDTDLRRECGELGFSLEGVGELGERSDVSAVMKESCETMEELVIIGSLVGCLGTGRGCSDEVSSRLATGIDLDTDGVEPVVFPAIVGLFGRSSNSLVNLLILMYADSFPWRKYIFFHSTEY